MDLNDEVNEILAAPESPEEIQQEHPVTTSSAQEEEPQEQISEEPEKIEEMVAPAGVVTDAAPVPLVKGHHLFMDLNTTPQPPSPPVHVQTAVAITVLKRSRDGDPEEAQVAKKQKISTEFEIPPPLEKPATDPQFFRTIPTVPHSTKPTVSIRRPEVQKL